ncbi:MAG: sulfotransferase [Planctomycetota bacterium]
MRSEAGSTLEPLLVLMSGRSGSTLLMQLLATSDEIGFRREPPFEVRHLSYLLRWAQSIGAEGAMTADSDRPREFFDAPTLGNRSEPSTFRWPGAVAEGLWRPAFESAWRAFSERAVRGPDYAPCGAARFHAEKASLWSAESLSELEVPHRRLYLLRDPRDVLLSIWSFNQKRGSLDFGVREGETMVEHAERFFVEMRDRLRLLLELQTTSDTSCIVRFDEMVEDLPEVAHQLGEFLGVRLDAGRVLADSSRFAGHRTSSSRTGSRWRSELSQELQARCEQILGSELEALGLGG